MEIASTDSDDSETTNERKKMRVSKRCCPHCEETVSYKTYRIHKRMHYDVSRSLWHKQGESTSLSGSPPQLSPPECIIPACASTPRSALTPSALYSAADESPPNFHHDDYGFSDSTGTSSDAEFNKNLKSKCMLLPTFSLFDLYKLHTESLILITAHQD